MRWRTKKVLPGKGPTIREPDPTLTNNWGPLSSNFHVEQPKTLIEWKFKSITYLPTYGLTWVDNDMVERLLCPLDGA